MNLPSDEDNDVLSEFALFSAEEESRWETDAAPESINALSFVAERTIFYKIKVLL